MSRYLGYYIEDDEKTYKSYIRHFQSHEIDLLPFDTLPNNIDDIYEKIIERNVDFVIIDFNLGKQPVSYDGMDVLKYIRERDPEIYLIYLTSMDFSTEFLPQFDQQIRKKDMHKEIDVIINRLNRAISRELSIKLEREIDNNYKLLEEKIDADIEYLKKLFEDGEKQ